MGKIKLMKITPAQASLLRYMRVGWELGHSSSYGSRTWVQKGGCGKGGESINVHPKTFQKLLSNNLIEVDGKRHMTSIYKLTELGKTIQL